MFNIEDNYCVILAGGKGRRLWPSSRQAFPKQFVDFFGTGRTQLQQTFDRFAKIFPKENIFVSTNVDYLELVEQQLPEVPRQNILAEPIHRNTAPSVAWASYRISRVNPRANLIVAPSDQAIFNDEAFSRNMFDGLRHVMENNCLLTMGVKPTRPEPGYGYIQLGESVAKNIHRVKSFTEKPERAFAKMFMDSGEFFWNTGLFLSNVDYLKSCFRKILPLVFDNLSSQGVELTPQEELDYVGKHFPLYPNLSVDYGILERSENVCVMKCDFGWADLGTWHSIYEVMSHGQGDNVAIDSDVIFDDCSDNIVKLPKGRLGVFNGLDGFIVAEEGNVLMICKKGDSSSMVRKFVNEVQMRKGDDFV